MATKEDNSTLPESKEPKEIKKRRGKGAVGKTKIQNRLKFVEIDRVLRDSVSSTEHKLLLRDAFDQLSITFINFLTIVEDLENALLFCHVNTFHPSIIKPSELLFELKRIERFYKEELPLATTPENLPFFEELIDDHPKDANIGNQATILPKPHAVDRVAAKPQDILPLHPTVRRPGTKRHSST
ncbi:unnamed protein product [Bemisia tabaci]|uniref:Uncharacterized protein n=1 Tax=Bemisia tabaci TaxID=7038 RepID=A0A9P0A394_BEMTA|nr:unnamed protein product [Bemisia tabaci]